MTEAQKQNIKKSLQDAIRLLAEVREQLNEANEIIHEEIEQLYIGRLLTHKKGASKEMFELENDKRHLRFMDEQLNTYAENIEQIINKYA